MTLLDVNGTLTTEHGLEARGLDVSPEAEITDAQISSIAKYDGDGAVELYNQQQAELIGEYRR